MVTALKHLQHFIRAKNNDDERDEIRAYALENADAIAEAFGVPLSSYTAGIARIADDSMLATRLLTEVVRARSTRRAQRRERCRDGAQASADVLGAASHWIGGTVVVDLVSLVASALTEPGDVLVFAAEEFEEPVAISMAPLVRLRALERADFSAFVDAAGLHVRWATGGLNIVPVADADANRIVVNLPRRRASLDVVTLVGDVANTNSALTSAVSS